MLKIKEKKNNMKTNQLLKIFFISLGTFFIGLGLIGIFIPILPTTPFLLLSAALYARSSDKFYNWLIENRLFGRYIKNYRNGRGIPAHIKCACSSRGHYSHFVDKKIKLMYYKV